MTGVQTCALPISAEIAAEAVPGLLDAMEKTLVYMNECHEGLDLSGKGGIDKMRALGRAERGGGRKGQKR